MATKAKTKRTAPEPVDEVEDDDEDLELEDLDADVEEDEAPAKSKRSKASDDVKFGAADLAALLSEKMGKTISARDLRTLLRKMAREDKPRIDREVSRENRQRYSWEGPDDPEVKRIIKAVTAGEIEQGKKEALDALKARKAEKDAAGGGKAKKSKKAKSAPEPEDIDDDDIDIDEDDE